MTAYRGICSSVHNSFVPENNTAMVYPTWVWAIITDADSEDLLSYCETWNKKLKFSIIANNPGTDEYEIGLEVDPALVSVSMKNRLEEIKDFIETYLSIGWKCTNISIAGNYGSFKVKVFDALSSPAFWKVQPPIVLYNGFNFYDDSDYYIANDQHSITVDYTGFYNSIASIPMFTTPPLSLLPPAELEAIIMKRVRDPIKERVKEIIGTGAVVSENTEYRQFTFIAGRATVRDAFINAVKEGFEKPAYCRKCKVTETGMIYLEQDAIEGEFCFKEINFNQFKNNVHDLLLD